jgi:thiamine transport system permease protein
VKNSPGLRALALWALPLVFLGIFFFYPLGSILLYSFGRSTNSPISVLEETFTSSYTWRVLGFTFWQALLSTLLTLLVGLPGAYLVARYQFRGKSLLLALTAIPFVMPTLVVAAALNALIGQRGWLNLGLTRLFNLSFPPLVLEGTLAAILLAHVFYNTTIVLRTVGDFWSHLDPRLQQAARVLGANGLKTLWTVTLPLLAPAISTAALLVFIFDFTSFGVILVLGGPRFSTLEVEIFYQATALFNMPQAAALSLLQLACTLALTITYSRLSRKLAQPLSLRPVTYTQRRLLTLRSRLFAGLMVSFLLVLLTAPLVALTARSLTRLEGDRGQRGAVQSGFTLDYYAQLAANTRGSQFYAPPGRAIAVSLTYALATVLLALTMGLPAAWALSQESQSLANRLLDPLLMLPLGTSAVTLGLGFILTLNHPPLDLRASPLLVPLAHTLVALPFVVRSLTPALRSIKPHLRQAASVLGASPWQVARTVDLPLTGRAILVAATFAFTISLGEFGATALIARPEYPTIPVMIYRFISQPGGLNYGQAMALSTLLMIVCAAGMLVIERLRIADIGEF